MLKCVFKKFYIFVLLSLIICNNSIADAKTVVKWQSVGKYHVTAYCPCLSCSEGFGRHTSSGKMATEGRTIAVDKFNPMFNVGEKVKINGHVYTVEDCGDLNRHGNSFDVFFNNHADTEIWGRKYIDVYKQFTYVIKPNKILYSSSLQANEIILDSKYYKNNCSIAKIDGKYYNVSGSSDNLGKYILCGNKKLRHKTCDIKKCLKKIEEGVINE